MPKKEIKIYEVICSGCGSKFKNIFFATENVWCKGCFKTISVVKDLAKRAKKKSLDEREILTSIQEVMSDNPQINTQKFRLFVDGLLEEVIPDNSERKQIVIKL
ncbi:hypothetical protein J4216_05320 [Candidatus Woesearchaeota archaeon]|nr:hypothetical protein [Candidatus Woesearchaeota archaeon]